MSQTVQEPLIPRGGLMAGAGLVLFALAAVTASRITGVGDVRMTVPAAVESRDLRFEDGKGGAVLVFDARDQKLVDELAPGSNGFIRVVLRGLARERKLGDIGQAPPFRLRTTPNRRTTRRVCFRSKVPSALSHCRQIWARKSSPGGDSSSHNSRQLLP